MDFGELRWTSVPPPHRDTCLGQCAANLGVSVNSKAEATLGRSSTPLLVREWITCCKQASKGAHSLKSIWDEMVGDIVKFGVRCLTGDGDMQLFSVVTELRALGLQAKFAAA